PHIASYRLISPHIASYRLISPHSTSCPMQSRPDGALLPIIPSSRHIRPRHIRLGRPIDLPRRASYNGLGGCAIEKLTEKRPESPVASAREEWPATGLPACSLLRACVRGPAAPCHPNG